MIENLPSYINIVFVLTTFLTVYLFYIATKKSKIALLILIIWLIIQSVIGLSGFYQVTDTIPPRFALLIGVPLAIIAAFFFTNKGKEFVDGIDVVALTYLHTVRIPVEFVLLWLYQEGKIPELMTFEGRNFDIISGLTAPFIVYFGFIKQKINKKIILAWNFICLGLLLNIVTNAVLSAPFVFQKFAFEQPNVAVLYFPFIWLPCCIVPIVLFSHLASIRKFLK